jgi:hypothetical protein
MFPNIKKTISQIVNHMIHTHTHTHTHTQESQENFINDKVQSSYVQCIIKEIKKPILTQQLLAKHDVK